MPDSGSIGGNLSNLSQSISSGFFSSGFFASGISSGVQTTNLQTTTGRVGQTYYADTQSSGGFQTSGKLNTNNLAQITPPGTNTHSVPGRSGEQNLFLGSNPMVAFFMDMDEMAQVLIKTDLLQATLLILEMAITNNLAQGKAAAILQSANADYTSHIAAAVSSFAQAGTALVQMGQTWNAENEADEMITNQKNGLQTSLDTENENVDDAQDELDENEEALNAAQANVNSAENELEDSQNTLKALKEVEGGAAPDDIESAQNEVTKAQRKLKAADTDLENANEDFRAAKRHLSEAQGKLQDAQSAQDDFAVHEQEKRQNFIQSKTQETQLASQFINQMINGFSEVIQADAALTKGASDATVALYSNYEQNAFKMMDQLIAQIGSNSKMVADLMQMLRNFSDQEKKLGGSLTAQAAA